MITSLGNLWIEKKKKEAITTIVKAYTPAVNELAGDLARDFDQSGDGYLAGYGSLAGQLENVSIGILSHSPAFEQRVQAVEALETSEKAKRNAKEIAANAKKAITNLTKANDKLAKVMEQGDYTADDIKAYAKSVQELVNNAKVLAEH